MGTSVDSTTPQSVARIWRIASLLGLVAVGLVVVQAISSIRTLGSWHSRFTSGFQFNWANHRPARAAPVPRLDPRACRRRPGRRIALAGGLLDHPGRCPARRRHGKGRDQGQERAGEDRRHCPAPAGRPLRPRQPPEDPGMGHQITKLGPYGEPDPWRPDCHGEARRCFEAQQLIERAAGSDDNKATARQGVEGMLTEFYRAVGWHVSVQWKQ